MPSTRTLPRPIAAVLEHHGALQTAYARQRVAHDKTEAFVGAVSDVLNEHDVSELSHLIAGTYDPSYDARRALEDAITVFRQRATDGLGAEPQLALLVDATDAGDDALLAAWCEALAMGIAATL